MGQSLSDIARDLRRAVMTPEDESAHDSIPIALTGAAMMVGATISTRPWAQLPSLLLLAGLLSLAGWAHLIVRGKGRLVLGMRSRRLAFFFVAAFLTQTLGLAVLAGDGIFRTTFWDLPTAGVFFLGALTNIALLAALVGAFHHQLRIGVWQPFVAAGVVIAIVTLTCAVAFGWARGWLVGWDSFHAAPPVDPSLDAGAPWAALLSAHHWVRLGLLSYVALPWVAFLCAVLLFSLFAGTKNALPAGLFCAACLVLAFQRMTFLELWLLAGSALPLVSFCEVSRPAGFMLVGMPTSLSVIAIVSALHVRPPRREMAERHPSDETEQMRFAFDVLREGLLAYVELVAGRAAARRIRLKGFDPEQADTAESLHRARGMCEQLLGRDALDRATRDALAALPPDIRNLAQRALV